MKLLSFRWVRFAIVPALTIVASVIWLDALAAQHFKSRFGDPLHVFAARWTDLGKAEPYFLTTAILAIGAWALGYLWKAKADTLVRIHKWAVQAFAMFLLSGILVQTSKHIVGRKRPYAVEDLSPHEFQSFTINYEFHSMPSGHSQVVFSAATVLTLLWPKAMVLWYSFAILIASLRVVTLNHWVSDTLAGAVLGIVGVLLARTYLQTTRFKVE